MSKVKIVVSSIFIMFGMMISGATAATVNVVDVLPYVVGGPPIDWQNINGTYDVFADDDYDAFYDSDHFVGVIPPASLADLTVIWSLRDDNSLIELATYVITDDLGAIIDQEFWVALVCHQEYVLEITSRWIGDGELIPNPLPPPVVAFLSAMAAIGFLVRRRRVKSN